MPPSNWTGVDLTSPEGGPGCKEGIAKSKKDQELVKKGIDRAICTEQKTEKGEKFEKGSRGCQKKWRENKTGRG